MQLYTQQPWWLLKNGLLSHSYSLSSNLRADVVIIGAGITGALVAHRLCRDGYRVAVLEKRHIGLGSTVASTAFLQYEIDKPLVQLQHLVGLQNAITSYQLCRQAIYQIRDICQSLGNQSCFQLRPSLQFASYKSHVPALYAEYKLRKQLGMDVNWIDEGTLLSDHHVKAPAAILSADGGEVDAYQFTHALFCDAGRNGCHVYTNTSVRHIEHGRQQVKLTTSQGCTVTARHLVIACGYESNRYLPKRVGHVRTTYAMVSEPVSQNRQWAGNALVWETADPYLYFRKLDGGRMLIGGKDDPYHHPSLLPSTIARKATLLEHAYNKRIVDSPIRADHSWGGAFVVTPDGLPYIGPVRERPHTLFALGYGGNGITFSAIASNILADQVAGRHNGNAHIFSFTR